MLGCQTRRYSCVTKPVTLSSRYRHWVLARSNARLQKERPRGRFLLRTGSKCFSRFTSTSTTTDFLFADAEQICQFSKSPQHVIIAYPIHYSREFLLALLMASVVGLNPELTLLFSPRRLCTMRIDILVVRGQENRKLTQQWITRNVNKLKGGK